MTLPPLVPLDCECSNIKGDPAAICGPCLLMDRVRDLLEIAFRFEGNEVAYGCDQRTADALQSLLDAYRDEAERRECPDTEESAEPYPRHVAHGPCWCAQSHGEVR